MEKNIGEGLKSSSGANKSLDDFNQKEERLSQEHGKVSYDLMSEQPIFSNQREVEQPLKDAHDYREGKNKNKKSGNEGGKRTQQSPRNRPKKTKTEMGAIGLSLAFGFTLGLLIIWINKDRLMNRTFIQLIATFFFHYFLILIVFIFQIIIHEAGHCVAALISGYDFVSFRVFSFMLAKYEDGFRLMRFSIPGTAGQSLMAPPPWNDGKFPYRFYLAGGVILNTLSGVFLVGLAFYIGLDQYWGRFSLVSALLAFFSALQNGIPMKINGMSNDGYDIMQAAKRENNRRVLRDILDFNARLQQGQLISEVPKSWLRYSDEEMLEHLDDKGYLGLLNSKLMFLMDAGDFEQAYFLVDAMVHQEHLFPMIRNELLCEKLYLELLLKQRPPEIEKLYNSDLKKYINQTKKVLISKRRILYAYHKLWTKNESKAASEKSAFNRLAPKYPILGELLLEKKLMEAVDTLSLKLE